MGFIEVDQSSVFVVVIGGKSGGRRVECFIGSRGDGRPWA